VPGTTDHEVWPLVLVVLDETSVQDFAPAARFSSLTVSSATGLVPDFSVAVRVS
jgi:hypothetical protein